MTGKIIANKGQLKVFGIDKYKPGQEVKVININDPSFIEIHTENTAPTRIMKHLVKVDSVDQKRLNFSR